MQRFDIIGDVHGCFDELQQLVETLDARARADAHSSGDMADAVRTLVFVGDLVDRGPRIPDVLRYVIDLCSSGRGLCVRGNHDDKLLRYLKGRRVNVNNGLEESVNQLASLGKAFRDEVIEFIEHLPYYLKLNDGTLIVVHAGLEEQLHDEERYPSTSDRVRAFALYGSTTGDTDEYGLPVRLNWAADYRGEPVIVYGHTPLANPTWQHNTINIDTGCVFGGRLTALRYPERELVSVPAKNEYAIPRRPVT